MNATKNMLYLAFTHPAHGAGDRSAAREAHQAFRRELEVQGTLLAGGPIIDEATGETAGAGLAILRVGSASEAEDIMRRDPFVVQGFRTYEIKPWRLQNGKL